MSTLKIDVATLTKYHQLLDRDQTTNTYCIMNEQLHAPVPGYGTFHSSLADLPNFIDNAWKSCKTLISLHTTICRTDLQGRRLANIQSMNHLVVDIDNQTENISELIKEHKPNLVVESSPKKYHMYWVIPEQTPHETWKKYQIAFTHKLRGDYNLINKTALIRVPGLMRLTKLNQVFIPKIIHVNETDSGPGQFSWVVNHYEEGMIELSAMRKEMSNIASALHNQQEVVLFNLTVGRNTTLFQVLKKIMLHDEGILEAALYAHAVRLNTQFKSPLDEREVTSIAQSVWRNVERLREEQAEEEAHNLEAIKTLIRSSIVGSNGTEPKKPQKLLAPPATETSVSENEKTNLTEYSNKLLEKIVREFNNEETYESAALKRPSNTIREVPKLHYSSFDAQAVSYAQILFETREDPVFQTSFMSALRDRNYVSLGDFILKHWDKVGQISKPEDCATLVVRDTNSWDQAIYRHELLNIKKTLAFINKTITHLFRLLKEEFLGKNKECNTRLAKFIRRYKKSNVPDRTGIAIGEAFLRSISLSGDCTSQDPDIIAFQNGVYNLATGKFTENYTNAISTVHTLNSYYVPDVARCLEEYIKQGTFADVLAATCPVFARYLEDWMPGDSLGKMLVMTYFGYCMTSDTRHQTCMFMYGPGGAGKGSITQVYCHILGDRNYVSADYSVLDGSFASAEIFHRLLTVIEEVDSVKSNVRFERLKKWLGGEKVTCERKYQDPYTTSIACKFVLQANHALQFDDEGNALRHRILPVGLEQSFRNKKNINLVKEILQSDANCIASLSCILWATLRNNLVLSNPTDLFKPSCRMIQVGTNIMNKLDAVRYTLETFMEKVPGNAVSTKHIKLIVEFVGMTENMNITNTLHIHEKIKQVYPFLRSTNHLQAGSDKTTRGFIGMRINFDKLIEQYGLPELVSFLSDRAPEAVHEMNLDRYDMELMSEIENNLVAN